MAADEEKREGGLKLNLVGPPKKRHRGGHGVTKGNTERPVCQVRLETVQFYATDAHSLFQTRN